MIRLLGLYREKECSPGRHQSNDALLLDEVACCLRARSDFSVELSTIEQASARRPSATLVFSMCQGPAALDLLAGWERSGVPIVNSPRAARNTYRDRLPALMAGAGVPFPETALIATRDPRAPDIGHGFWLKRGDVHASVSADVQWVDSLGAFEACCADFMSRGIEIAAVQAHRTGDEVKFYGVAGAFFHWFYAGPSHGYTFDPVALRQLASRAAGGLDVFGGDVIVSPSGELTLIDLNDWPSFAPCRTRAAEAIADHVTGRVHAAWNRGLVSSANQSAV